MVRRTRRMFKVYSGQDDAAPDYISTLGRMDQGAMNTGGNIDKFTSGLMAGKWAQDPLYAFTASRAHTRP